ncbi:hypothetical protein [Actinomadura welshii]|uniref:hypothetical protein n=1 Tax=Actinomadura welshii TaxID=3103817 RepID=UPI0012691D22|nr:hypothetical protein [Actinomadura madurae]
MTNTDGLDPQSEIFYEFFESYFRSYIEDGSIPIANRSVSEIMSDFDAAIAELLKESQDGGHEIHATLDYRSTILERADTEAREGSPQIAITLYATWLEHFFNGIINLSMIRRGYSAKTVTSLLRELRIPTKATALWEVCELPSLHEGDIKLMERVLNARNAFVHYKWAPAPEEELDSREERVREALREVADLVDFLLGVEEAEIWGGRKQELIGAYYERLRENEREIGPFIAHLASNKEADDEGESHL